MRCATVFYCFWLSVFSHGNLWCSSAKKSVAAAAIMKPTSVIITQWYNIKVEIQTKSVVTLFPDDAINNNNRKVAPQNWTFNTNVKINNEFISISTLSIKWILKFNIWCVLVFFLETNRWIFFSLLRKCYFFFLVLGMQIETSFSLPVKKKSVSVKPNTCTVYTKNHNNELHAHKHKNKYVQSFFVRICVSMSGCTNEHSVLHKMWWWLSVFFFLLFCCWLVGWFFVVSFDF